MYPAPRPKLGKLSNRCGWGKNKQNQICKFESESLERKSPAKNFLLNWQTSLHLKVVFNQSPHKIRFNVGYLSRYTQAKDKKCPTSATIGFAGMVMTINSSLLVQWSGYSYRQMFPWTKHLWVFFPQLHLCQPSCTLPKDRDKTKRW